MRRALLAVLVLTLAACGGDGEEANPPTVADGSFTDESACRDVDPPEQKADGGREKPDGELDPADRHSLVVNTTCGTFVIELDVRSAPNTAASLVALAESGFFDSTTFHRIVPGFVIQGGDPTGTGTGGPGYQTVDPPPAGARYTRGVVAMAKTAADPSGAAGSQFFVVTADDAGLPAEYAVVGRVTKGMEVVERIEALGDPATELPRQPVVVEHLGTGQP